MFAMSSQDVVEQNNHKDVIAQALLADFSAIKDEILRRSTIQTTVLGFVITGHSWLFVEWVQGLSIDHFSPSIWMIVASCIIQVLGWMFYYKEMSEIGRLSGLVKSIENQLRESFNIPKTFSLFVSEAGLLDADQGCRYRLECAIRNLCFKYPVFFYLGVVLVSHLSQARS
jgi:hypothetical protein